jgi:hypothetical protein
VGSRWVSDVTSQHWAVSGDLTLFGEDKPDAPVQPVGREPVIADWLVDLMREALTACGLRTMAERQQAIEAVVERPVHSLRSLSSAAAWRILERLSPIPTQQTRMRSAWEDGDEDTWIDRL